MTHRSEYVLCSARRSARVKISLAPFSPRELESNDKTLFNFLLIFPTLKTQKNLLRKLINKQRKIIVFAYGDGRINIKEKTLLNLRLREKVYYCSIWAHFVAFSASVPQRIRKRRPDRRPARIPDKINP